MQIKDFVGRPINWTAQGKRRDSASNLHKRARELISQHYPGQIQEEVRLPGSKPPLYFDFVVPGMKMCVEVQGLQHFKLSSLFHKNKKDLLQQMRRDSKKAEWCEDNDLKLVLLFDGEDEETWMKKLFL